MMVWVYMLSVAQEYLARLNPQADLPAKHVPHAVAAE